MPDAASVKRLWVRCLTVAQRLWQAVQSNVRYKLLILVLVPLLLLAPTLLALSAHWSWNYTYKQLFFKVNTDLSVAHDIFQRIQTDQQQTLRSVAGSYEFRDAFDAQNTHSLTTRLQTLVTRHQFAFLNLLSADVTQRLEVNGWQSWSTKQSRLVASAVESGDAVVGIEIYNADEFARENPVLADQIKLQLVATPRAEPTVSTIEDRAMLIRVLQPIVDRQRQVVGWLEGAVLLNRNFVLVDEIRDLVYGEGNLAPGSLGTVTVFLDDVRVSTNVPDGQQERALGTRVSAEVRQSVLVNREIWVNRAFVVNDWYISAYEPIIDFDGQSVGMLYAGFLETPLRHEMYRALGSLALVLLIGTVIAALGAIRGAQSIFKPIESIATVIRTTRSGVTRQRIGSIESQDEIGVLATQFDQMLDTLGEHQASIERAAAELEIKVQARTSELSIKNTRLQETITLLRETRRQLATAEKLAALGELTAGVAHEINNPIAVILGNMDILISEIGDGRDRVETEIDLIIEQVYRIQSIVDRLLQYSRPSSYAGYVSDVDVAELLVDTHELVRHELDRKQITLVLNGGTEASVRINRQELQQVLVNLLLNAAHAVHDHGAISVAVREWRDFGVEILIRDNGIGIPATVLHRVFDPFYTFQKEQGTGLGLSVSYGIIRRYGGFIKVASVENEYTEFSVQVRFEPLYEDDTEALMGGEAGPREYATTL